MGLHLRGIVGVWLWLHNRQPLILPSHKWHTPLLVQQQRSKWVNTVWSERASFTHGRTSHFSRSTLATHSSWTHWCLLIQPIQLVYLDPLITMKAIYSSCPVAILHRSQFFLDHSSSLTSHDPQVGVVTSLMYLQWVWTVIVKGRAAWTNQLKVITLQDYWQVSKPTSSEWRCLHECIENNEQWILLIFYDLNGLHRLHSVVFRLQFCITVNNVNVKQECTVCSRLLFLLRTLISHFHTNKVFWGGTVRHSYNMSHAAIGGWM